MENLSNNRQASDVWPGSFEIAMVDRVHTVTTIIDVSQKQKRHVIIVTNDLTNAHGWKRRRNEMIVVPHSAH